MIGHNEIADHTQENSAVGVRILAHAPVALGRQLSQFRFQASLLIEQFLGPIAPQPVFQTFEVFGMGPRVG